MEEHELEPFGKEHGYPTILVLRVEDIFQKRWPAISKRSLMPVLSTGQASLSDIDRSMWILTHWLLSLSPPWRALCSMIFSRNAQGILIILFWPHWLQTFQILTSGKVTSLRIFESLQLKSVKQSGVGKTTLIKETFNIDRLAVCNYWVFLWI
jgi:hypothetical protein